MKTLTILFVAVCACNALALSAFAGPEPMREAKDKVVIPQEDCCLWSGFYVGLNVGGQFGTSEDRFNIENELIFSWDYSESGIVAGGQVGYNRQFGKWLVLGVEADGGYMNLDGKGLSPIDSPSFRNFIEGETSSDFYMTFRGRVGIAHDCWLFYATGGGIGVNYETRQTFIPEPEVFSGHKEELDWGYTVGGGIERKIGCHWSVKLEYLYFNLEEQNFSFTQTAGTGASLNVAGPVTNGPGAAVTHFSSDTDGHMVRGGLNYHF